MFSRQSGAGRKRSARSGESLPAEKINEMIQAKAYELYCKRGQRSGDALNDWLLAEREIQKKLGLPKQ